MTDDERRVILELTQKAPKIVKPKDLDAGAYLACSDDLTLPGELTNCAHDNSRTISR